jgi:hypothetical protein
MPFFPELTSDQVEQAVDALVQSVGSKQTRPKATELEPSEKNLTLS